MKCDRSVGYLDQGEYTYIIMKVLIRVISLLLWSCQLTGKKKFEHRLKKSATVNKAFSGHIRLTMIDKYTKTPNKTASK